MIHIKDLTVKNFMSVGNATQAIQALEHIDIEAEVQAHRDLEQFHERKKQIDEHNKWIRQIDAEQTKLEKEQTRLRKELAALDDPKLLLQIYQAL